MLPQGMQNILYILPRGLAIGVLVSAPMGPVGMLIIQRTLLKGRMPAFFSGMGAALSDLIYCLLTGLCVSFITDFINAHQFALQVVGGVVLIGFGLFLMRSNPTRSLKSRQIKPAANYWLDFVTGFGITFSNPLILFFIIGLFARFNFILPEFGPYHYVLAFSTILCGALVWWWVVTWLVDKLRAKINVRSLKVINIVIGLVLISMAVFGLVMALKNHVL